MKVIKKGLKILTAALTVSLFTVPLHVGAAANISPEKVNVTLQPGDSKDFDVNVTTDEQAIPQLDVTFAIDRTGSMGDEIRTAQSKSIEIMNNIRELVPDSSFGVVSFMDYPGDYGYEGYPSSYGNPGVDEPFILNQANTKDVDTVAGAIDSLTLGSGGDTPESYTRVLYELAQGTNEWRSYAKKVVILIGDAPTHDLNFNGYNFGGDPGRDGIAGTKDDLDFEAVVKELNEKDITVLAVQGDTGGSEEATATFKGMSEGFAGAEGTRGQYFQLSSAEDIPKAIADMIGKEVSTIKSLKLEVPEEYQSWIQLDKDEYIEVGPNTTKTFHVKVTPPKGTPNGDYKILLRALGDGAYLGSTELNVTVKTGSGGDQEKVVLDHLEVSESSIFLQPKKSAKVKVYAVYSDGTTKEITTNSKTVYRTKSTSVASAAKGVVKAGTKQGTTDLMVSYGGKAVSIPVTVGLKKITSLEISAPALTVNVEERKQVELHAVYEDGSVKDVTDLAYWITDDSTIADVERGEVEGIEAGTALVRAYYGGEEAYVPVEVIDPNARELVGLETSDTSLKLKVGEEAELGIWAVYDNGDKEEVTDNIAWQSGKSSIASVFDGVIEAKKVGKTKVTATYEGKSVSVDVEVFVPKVKSLSASAKSITLTQSSTKQLRVKALYDTGETVDVTQDADWFTKRSTIAEVDNGLVKAVSTGSTTITVKYAGISVPIAVKVK